MLRRTVLPASVSAAAAAKKLLLVVWSFDIIHLQSELVMDEAEKRQFEADLSKRGLELGEHVRLARTIQAPAADVWKVISKPGELNKYHPYTRRVLEIHNRGS